jgi:hypothetical protein
MTALALTATAAIALLAIAFVWTYWRYFHNRRLLAQDYQAPLALRQSFHVCLLFQVANGRRLDETARQVTHAILSGGDVRLIYAGQVVFNLDSVQLGPTRWDGLLFFELPSRDRFNAAYTERFRRVREQLPDSYLFGVRRSALGSSVAPLTVFGLRLSELLRGRLKAAPLIERPELRALPEHGSVHDHVRRLQAAHEINRTSLVVYTLARHDRDSTAAPIEGLTRRLLARLARHSMGPLHNGQFRRIEHNAVFDNLFSIQYPSARDFAELLLSQYHETIIDNPALNDALVLPTVPITARL